jgi:hypothetical protein
VATVCGYPVRFAELTGLALLPASAPGCHWAEQRVALELRQPTEAAAPPWTTQVAERRLVTGPGPAWILLGSQPYAGRAARRTA